MNQINPIYFPLKGFILQRDFHILNLRVLMLLIIFICSIPISAQNGSSELYAPRNIKKSYKNGTRSLDGSPGKNYWQNYGHYDINLIVKPPDRIIHGSEEITYFNNSPDTLKELDFRLNLNIHKPGAKRFLSIDSSYLTSGIHIDSYSENNIEKSWIEDPYTNTMQRIQLLKPMIPKDSVKISFNWHYQISLESGREGMIDYQGWAWRGFDDFFEFYNDFNDYTLNVQVPKNYIVWATGTLLNSNDLLQPVYANKLFKSMVSDSIFHIVTKEDWSSKNITRQNSMNTWKWKVNNVTDMTLAISDHYNWDASSIVVDDKTKRRASVQSAFYDTATDFHSMVRYGNFAVEWFSQNWPGIPYPYEKMTIIQGYSEMEYPMMVNDKSFKDTLISKNIVEHEISHTYMPFYMGINETQYGFMDEGWATAFALLIGRADYGVEKAEKMFIDDQKWWIQGLSFDLPIVTSENNSSGGASANEYGKPALGYLALKDMLGDEIFKKCLHFYMDTWHGKHPIPWDFFYSFNTASGQNLNWFWNNWFFSHNYIDLGIRDVNKSDKGYSVTIDNIGGMAVPFALKVLYNDGSREEIHQTPVVWKNNQMFCVIKIQTKKKVKSLLLDSGVFGDADETNNTWVSK
jgi:hypothetical protein